MEKKMTPTKTPKEESIRDYMLNNSQQNPTQSNGSMNNGLGTSSADTILEEKGK